MNKVGRRRLSRRYTNLEVSRQFLMQAVGAEAFVRSELAAGSSGRITAERWLAWRPVGDADDEVTDHGEYFLRDTFAFTRRQMWEWRFIGRRRR